MHVRGRERGAGQQEQTGRAFSHQIGHELTEEAELGSVVCEALKEVSA